MAQRAGLFILLAAMLSTGCGQRSAPPPSATAPTLAGDLQHPGATQGWVDTRLYFGLGPADHPEQGVSEADWRAFLDAEVTPRFPSGLSVVDVYGQWQGRGSRHVERQRSKMLIVVYANTPENSAKIDAIRTAWKRKTGDESVLRVTEPAEVWF